MATPFFVLFCSTITHGCSRFPQQFFCLTGSLSFLDIRPNQRPVKTVMVFQKTGKLRKKLREQPSVLYVFVCSS